MTAKLTTFRLRDDTKLKLDRLVEFLRGQKGGKFVSQAGAIDFALGRALEALDGMVGPIRREPGDRWTDEAGQEWQARQVGPERYELATLADGTRLQVRVRDTEAIAQTKAIKVTIRSGP